jgi:hypothetical protein
MKNPASRGYRALGALSGAWGVSPQIRTLRPRAARPRRACDVAGSVAGFFSTLAVDLVSNT